jgi:hypothetical protein
MAALAFFLHFVAFIMRVPSLPITSLTVLSTSSFRTSF